ncbi:hypothetical protein BLNAU_13672 [Blattamonas nauphoetae]|uniref:Uncharacterized protein n=1 Tax=Blattamonas nauphoetae TaxID=2049346 RepID=A0ABQ9XJ33_9EUKA|nr:hypothetical protein BLNAU_13672 [Blattamonas nauphoetae]
MTKIVRLRFGSSSLCLSVETIPRTLALNNTWFSSCSSSGKAGSLVLSLPIDTVHPSSADSNTIASKSLYNNWFEENSGFNASDIFVDETALALFDAASFEEMSSYSQSSQRSEAQYAQHLSFVQNTTQPAQFGVVPMPVGVHVAAPVTAPQFNARPLLFSTTNQETRP